MLAEVPLPAGSSESSTEPAEADSLLGHPAFGPLANAVDEHALWVVPATPAETLAYICAHLLPGGGRAGSWGAGPTGQSFPESESSGFAWPGSPGWLVVNAVRLANGSTALRVDAEVVWVIPRAASERIPAGARLLTISVHKPGPPFVGIKSKRPAVLGRLPSRVTSAARIEKIVALLNELRVLQPGREECLPERDGSAQVQLGFYTSSSASPLAVADISTAHCDRGGVSLTIDGMAEPELEGRWSLVEAISRTLKIRPVPEKPRGIR